MSTAEGGTGERYYDPPLCNIPEAIVLDFDRTIGDVNMSMLRLYNAAEHCSLKAEPLKEAYAQAKKDGGSYDPLSAVYDQLDEAGIDKFGKHFVYADGPQILTPDSARFLMRLQEHDIPHLVMTYCANVEWQVLKLQQTKYFSGGSFMNHPNKGIRMKGWQSADGGYYFGTLSGGYARYRAERLCLLEDKPEALAGLPEGSVGFLVDREGKFEQTSLDIPRIESLDQLIIVDGILQLGDIRDQQPASKDLMTRRYPHFGERPLPYPLPFVRYIPQ